MRTAPARFAVVLVSTATLSVLDACGARTGNELDLSATGPELTSDGGGTTPGASLGDTPTQYESPQDACLTSSKSTHAYASLADLQSLLIGRWMLCNPGSSNGYWLGASFGVDLLADGHVYPLYRAPNGSIIRGGADYAVWHYTLVPAQGTAFDMAFEGGGDPTVHAVLTDDPRKLVMDDGQNRDTFAPAQ